MKSVLSLRSVLIVTAILTLALASLAQNIEIESVSYDIQEERRLILINVKFKNTAVQSSDTQNQSRATPQGFTEDIQHIFLCGKEGSTASYSKREQFGTNSGTFYIPVGTEGDGFRLSKEWQSFVFHLRASTANKECKSGKREPTFDIQITRANITQPDTKYEMVRDSVRWIAQESGGNYTTKGLSLKVKPSRCEKFKVEIRHGITSFGESETVIRCPGDEIQEIEINKLHQSIKQDQALDIYVSGNTDKIGSFNTLQPIAHNFVQKVELTDGSNSSNLLTSPAPIITDTNSPKVLTVTTKENADTEVVPVDKCVDSETAPGQPAGPKEEHKFTIRLSRCSAGVVNFRIRSTGSLKQPLMGEDLNRIYTLRIENRTHFDGPLSFVPSPGKTVLKYKLTRRVPNTVRASVNGNPISLSAEARLDNGYYTAEIPNTIVDEIQRVAADALKANGHSVEVVFKVIDNTPGAQNNGEIGAFAVNTYAINAEIIKQIKEGPKLDEKAAESKAKELLNLKDSTLADNSRDKEAVDYLASILRKDKSSSVRSQVTNILFFAGKVGMSLMGIPIPF